jgi:hypothetical protein
MCTVSVIPGDGLRGTRLIVNRDERRTRPVAWPPTHRETGGTAFIAPTDSQAKGTWIAASSTGIAYAIMNAAAREHLLPSAGTRSRGHVIPELVSAKAIDEVGPRLQTIALHRFAPFRLIAVAADRFAVWAWDGRSLGCPHEALRTPRLFASSSLGDLVEAPRRELFARLLASDTDPWRAQDRLHVHSWPDRRHLSANMSRANACTVSRTTVVVADSRIEMSYAPFLDGWPGPVSQLSLIRSDAAVAAVA